MKKYFLYIIIIICTFACKKDKPPVRPAETNNSPTAPGQELKGVFICNEGNFTFGNASISYISNSNSLTEDLYKSQNNANLGDVAQSMIRYNGNFYIVVNNSGKVEVVGGADFKHKASITGLTSPRYMVALNGKAYVTDLFANAISVLNLNTNTKTGSIACSGWTEELILYNTKVYVTNLRRDKIYVIDTNSDQLTDSITAAQATGGIVKDKNNKLWVLCGDAANNVPSKLLRIDPLTKSVENTFTFPTGESASKLRINGNGDVLYYLSNNGVCRMNISDANLPSAPVIGKGTHLFYNMAIDPVAEVIYTTDAIDYVQKGYVYRYDPSNFSVIDSFKVGIIPGEVMFYR